MVKSEAAGSVGRKGNRQHKETHPSGLNLILVAVAKLNFPESKNRMNVSCSTSVHTVTSSNGPSASPPMMELATFPIPDWRGSRDLGRRLAETSEERN